MNFIKWLLKNIRKNICYEKLYIFTIISRYNIRVQSTDYKATKRKLHKRTLQTGGCHKGLYKLHRKRFGRV